MINSFIMLHGLPISAIVALSIFHEISINLALLFWNKSTEIMVVCLLEHLIFPVNQDHKLVIWACNSSSKLFQPVYCLKLGTTGNSSLFLWLISLFRFFPFFSFKKGVLQLGKHLSKSILEKQNNMRKLRKVKP